MKLLFYALVFSLNLAIAQNDNIFLNRDFWKKNPSVTTIEEKISAGHDATQLNRFGFDAVTYALLGNVDNNTIKYLLQKKGNDVNKLTHDGRTYIFWAAYKDNLEIMNYLLAHGAKTDVIDDKGYSLLNFAATTGQTNPKLYDLVIANGGDIKAKTPKGANALLLLIPNLKDLNQATYFTSKGLNLFSTDKYGNGAFNYTAQKGNKAILEQLIAKGVPYKALNKNDGNAFLFATRRARRGYNSLAFFQYLESLGINPNVTNKDGKTPLHNLAYANKDIETFNYFLSKGVNPNQTDGDGNTPLINAAYRNDLAIIKLLAKDYKDINHKNSDGHSALTYAIEGNKLEVVNYFINENADVNVIDSKGNNLMYYLIDSYSSKNKDLFEQKLKVLITKGLAIRNPQKNGNTLYHLAIAKNSLELLEFVDKLNIDINTKNKEGITPLQKAVMIAKDTTIIKHLLQHGADQKIITDFDESIYDLAKENEALKNVNISFLK